MKSLASQIRIQKWNVDEAQRRLADLERLAARLAEDLIALDGEMRHERDIAARSAEAAATYHEYVAAALRRQETLRRSIAEVETQVGQAREELRDAFSNLKKFELAAEAADLRARKAREARDLRVQDEVALSIFRRKNA